MRIVGVDLSLTSTGIATPDGTQTVRSKRKGIERLNEIASRVVFECGDQAAHAIIEGYSYGSRNSQAHTLGELGGVVRYRLWRAGIRWTDVPPASLKRYACGRGNADKGAVLSEAIRRLGYQGSSNDEADAVWLFQIGLALYAPDEAVTVPAAHRAALDKIAVPA